MKHYSFCGLASIEIRCPADQTPVQLAGVAAATPPAGAEPLRTGAFDAPTEIPQGQGSNAYALGREVTKTGHGVLLANPHYPWDGLNRFRAERRP